MTRRRSDNPEGSRRRRRKPTMWQRFLLVTIVVVICLVGFAFIRKMVRPAILYFSEHTEVQQLEARLNKLTAENQSLEQKRKCLQTPSGAETEARKLGYVRPGEVSIVVEN